MNNAWDNAQPNTLWKVTGRVSDDHSFQECVAVALPHSVTGGSVLFAMLPPLDYTVTPDQITAATEYIAIPAAHLPCDGGCSYNAGPDETCSRHGRRVREVWGIADAALRRESGMAMLLADLTDVLRPHDPGHDGADPARVRDDYMTRAQAADTAWALLNTKEITA